MPKFVIKNDNFHKWIIVETCQLSVGTGFTSLLQLFFMVFIVHVVILPKFCYVDQSVMVVYRFHCMQSFGSIWDVFLAKNFQISPYHHDYMYYMYMSRYTYFQILYI